MMCGSRRWPLPLGTYRFGRYRKADRPDVRLVPPDGIDVADVARMAEAAALARDLINTPPNDMGPEELTDAAAALAKKHGAKFRVITGAALKKDYPLIHAVGQGLSPRSASDRAGLGQGGGPPKSRWSARASA